MKIAFKLCLLPVLAGIASDGEATAIFSATGTATLELLSANVSPGFFDVNSDDFVDAVGSVSGTAVGNAFPLDAGVGLFVEAQGQAAGDGVVDAFAQADGLLAFSNVTSTALELSFELSYGISAIAPVDDVSSEDALALTFIELAALGDFLNPGNADIVSFVVGDALGIEVESDSDTVPFSLELPAGGTGELLLLLDGSGFAEAFAPEPSTIALIILAGAYCARASRRRNERR